MTRKYDRIVPAVQAIVQEYGGMLLTLRQIYYRLVAAQVMPNTLSQYKSLSAILVEARMSGDLGFNVIEDRTRGIDFGHGEDITTAARFHRVLTLFRDLSERYEMPLWWGQPRYIQVWVEKEALSRIFSDITREEGVDLAVCRGYPSLTFLKDAALELSGRVRVGGRTWEDIHVLYFGDYDPSGLDIERYIEERLGDLGAYPQVRRVVLTREQVDEFQLPPAPAKTSDSRYWTMEMKEGEAIQVEMDAIEPRTLQELVREAVRDKYDVEAGERRENVLTFRQERIQNWVDEVFPGEYEGPGQFDPDDDAEFPEGGE